jgi:phosphohistidine phosphatase SixA
MNLNVNLNVMGTLLSKIVLSFGTKHVRCRIGNCWRIVRCIEKVRLCLVNTTCLGPRFWRPLCYNLQDCKTQRNLDSKGREQAQRIGQWLKTQGVNQALVFSSAWCRCKETAEKLDFGQPVYEASLNSFFDDMRQGPQSNARLQKFIANQLKTKQAQALILVTHHVNIAEFMGQNIGSGDMALVKVDANGKALSFKVYPSP